MGATTPFHRASANLRYVGAGKQHIGYRELDTGKVIDRLRPNLRQPSTGHHFQLKEQFRRNGSTWAFVSCFAGGSAA
jgi:hypothetical protein